MASSTPTSRTINIYINSPSAQKTLNDLNARAEKLTNSIKKGEAAGKDMSKSMTQLAATKSKISELEGVISGKMAPSLNMARTRANELRRELERMSADAPGYAQKFAEFQQAQKIFQGIQQEIRGVGSVLNGTQKQVSAFWSQVRTISIGSFIGNGLQSLIDKAAGYFSDIIGNNAKLSDSLSDIQKATNLSAKEVDYLNTALAKLDTRTSMDQLREIAVGLGQIGQAANESSVAAIDKIVVALGDEFGGGAREITTVLGVLRNNLQDIKSGNYGDDMLRIGNALNVLGAEGLATAPVVVDFANRMSGVASTFKLSSGQILGTAAAMQELGIPAERGSTAFIKLLQKMSTETKTYAHVASYAGISTKDFIDLLNTDMLAALSKVSEGVNAAGQNNVQLGKILKDLDADGSGAGEVLSKLGTNAELLEGKIELATGALQNNNSISQEFSLKNNNLAADLAKVEKAFSSLATSPGANGFVSKAIGAASIFAGLLTFIFGHLGTITTLIGLYAAAWILANNQMIIHNAQLLYYNARIAISKTLLTIASAAQVIHTVLVMAMTRAYAAATPVVTTFNAVFAATPFGAALTLLTLLGAGIIATTALVSNYTTAT
jgi:TP901 family phage tail tape measure protein